MTTKVETMPTTTEIIEEDFHIVSISAEEQAENDATANAGECEGCDKLQTPTDLLIEKRIIQLGSDCFEERGIITLCGCCWKELVKDQLEYALECGEEWVIEDHKKVLAIIEEYC